VNANGALNVVRLLVKILVAQFIFNEGGDQNKASQADGQTGDVDEGVDFVVAQIAKSDFEVVGEHDVSSNLNVMHIGLILLYF
jgi:hypothetical protein